MLDELIIHIGMPKTGSTSIQRVLARHTSALRDAGVIFPKSRSKAAGHPELAWALKGVVPGAESTGTNARGIAKGFLKQAEESGMKRMFLSSEEFGVLPMQYVTTLHKLLPAKKYRILTLLRRQDAYLEAAFKQQIRFRADNANYDLFEFYLRSGFHTRFNYLDILRRWARTFGAESVSASTFEAAAAAPGGLLGHILSASNIEIADEKNAAILDSDRENVSLDAVGVMAMMAICRTVALSKRTNRALFVELLGMREERNAKLGLMTPGQRAALVEFYQQSNINMMKQYGISEQWKIWDDLSTDIDMPQRADVQDAIDAVSKKFPELEEGAVSAL